jgi:hypothetical protein
VKGTGIMNFYTHFLDEMNGSSNNSAEIPHIIEQGDYLCVEASDSLLHIYRAVDTNEQVHPAVCQMEHNGRTYRLETIEDGKW